MKCETVPIETISDSMGWHYEDPEITIRLVASVRRYGQLRPIIVGCSSDGSRQIVDGREVLNTCRAIGMIEVSIVDIGTLADGRDIDAMLALGCGFEVDYARVAAAVCARLDNGVTKEELAMRSPFSPERIEDLGRLSKWDWSVYSKETGQSPVLDWDTEMISMPADTTAAELVREAEAVPPETPVADVVQHLVEHRRKGTSRDQLLFEF